MTRSPVSAFLLAGLGVAIALGACRPTRPSAVHDYPRPQVSGDLTVAGLHAPVRVVRDRWGVPHIYAQNADDLFFAQGFVQAQDRLFQMDLWRRASQGHLSEVLGSNFIGRDVMTRRVAYRGDPAAEWSSYAPDAKAIAEAFVRGVNAEVAIARRQLPEPFVLAGWQPGTWRAEDLLARADAFRMSGNAFAEIFRARVINAAGAAAAILLPLDPPAPQVIPPGLDTHDINSLLADALHRIGTAPFFMGLARDEPAPAARSPHTDRQRSALSAFSAVPAFDPGAGGNSWVVSPDRTGTGAPIVASDPHGALENPSLRYLVHLSAPGWNVEGTTVPWLPGVAIGHNDRVAWGAAMFDADVQDLYVEQVNPANPHQVRDGGRWVNTTVVHDAIPVRGRSKPFTFDHEFTRHGPIVAVDSEKHLAFALRWAGSEPGTAGDLAALALDRAASATAFHVALGRWKMPAETFVYADVDRTIGYQAAGLVPLRRTWNGTLPVPGWTGAFEWAGWLTLDDLPHGTSPANGYFATANNNLVGSKTHPAIGFEWASPARISRIAEVFDATAIVDMNASRALQSDVTSWNAEQLVPLLDDVHSGRAEVEAARERLRAWDRRLTTHSEAATLYELWERALGEQLVAGKLDAGLAREYLARVDATLVPALVSPSAAWFGKQPAHPRDALVVRALEQAVDALQKLRGAGPADWGNLHTATFAHVLAITAGTRARFDLGPFDRPGDAHTVNATYGPGLEQTGGASFRELLDVGEWDRSLATSAPGQSELPSSPHFADLAKLWAEGEYFPLVFSDAAVQKNAETTLILRPSR